MAEYKPVPHTCPAIDRVKKLIRKHMADPEAKADALSLMEELREQNSQLRDNATVLLQEKNNGN